MAGEDEDRVKVLRLTVSEGPPSIDTGTSPPGPAVDTPGVSDQLMQPPAPKADVELPATQAASGPSRERHKSEFWDWRFQ
jgi:hypothetical protein